MTSFIIIIGVLDLAFTVWLLIALYTARPRGQHAGRDLFQAREREAADSALPAAPVPLPSPGGTGGSPWERGTAAQHVLADGRVTYRGTFRDADGTVHEEPVTVDFLPAPAEQEAAS